MFNFVKRLKAPALLLNLAVIVAMMLGSAACQTAPAQPPEEPAPVETEVEEQAPDLDEENVRIALVREIGDGAFMARYLAGAQSMADELGIELIESNRKQCSRRPGSNGHYG
jgi:ABC-type sugar transport system substrate-binding protein